MKTSGSPSAPDVPVQPSLNTNTLYLWKRLIRVYLRPYLGLLLWSLLFMLIAAATTAILAQLMQPILDDVLVEKNQEAILPVASAALFTFILRGIVSYFQATMMAKVGQSVVSQIQQDVFTRLMQMDLEYFHRNPSGQLISRILNDVNVMRMAVVDSVTGMGKSLFTLIFLIAVMFMQDWKLSLAAFVILPFAAGFVAYLGKKLRRLSGTIQDETAVLSALLSQTFRGIRQVKSYGMEAFEISRSARAVEQVKKLNIKSVRVGDLSTPVNEMLVGFIFFGVIVYGGYQALNDNMSAGQLGAFLAALLMAYEPMKKLAKLNNSLQKGMGAAERIFDILDEGYKIDDKPEAKALDASKPSVCFDAVEFRYKEDGVNILNKISFTVPHGKVYALVGPSGAGKSTILNLIPRFYDVSAGAVKIGDQDVRDVTLASVRANIALVSQDITIFDDTVMANIRYGRIDATDDEVIDAAKKAFAHDFIELLPMGYETVLGEDGVSLSGGQRQRISIARALLKDAPILLLDEATSALDAESEQAVQEALKELEKGRTTIVIAHRLSTIQNADQIIVLDQGQIAEQGTHAELMQNDALYAKMKNMVVNT